MRFSFPPQHICSAGLRKGIICKKLLPHLSLLIHFFALVRSIMVLTVSRYVISYSFAYCQINLKLRILTYLLIVRDCKDTFTGLSFFMIAVFDNVNLWISKLNAYHQMNFSMTNKLILTNWRKCIWTWLMFKFHVDITNMNYT